MHAQNDNPCTFVSLSTRVHTVLRLRLEDVSINIAIHLQACMTRLGAADGVTLILFRNGELKHCLCTMTSSLNMDRDWDACML